MARVLLPCDVEEWSEHKKLFLLLSYVRSVEELNRLIETHTRQQLAADNTLGRRLSDLAGLKEFLAGYCTADERKTFLGKTLPFIAKSAALLEERIPECGISFLESQDVAALVLGRKLALSLLANGFLCTYPCPPNEEREVEGVRGNADIVFARRFSFKPFFDVFLTKEAAVCKTQAAKLKCVLCYFQRAAMDKCNLSGVITLRRQVVGRGELPSLADWTGSKFPLCPVVIDAESRIEDTAGLALQVDFANKAVGGSVLGGGRAQEEIRFCVCPELLISLLIMDTMADNEAIIVTGIERFADYKGYGRTLEFEADYVDDVERDVFGNILTSVVAIDAQNVRSSPALQYQQAAVLRELNKAYVGFTCQQDRGDISMEQLALSVKRGSTVFFTEFPDYDSFTPELRPGALGNLDISTFTSSYGTAPFKVNLPSVGSALSDRSSDAVPLSPIMEETPASATQVAYDDLALNLSAAILKSSFEQVGSVSSKAAGLVKSSSSSSNVAVNDLISSLSSSILQSSVQLASSEPPAPTPSSGGGVASEVEEKESDNQADRIAKGILSDIFSGFQLGSSLSTEPPRSSGQPSDSTAPPPPVTGLASFAEQLAGEILSSAVSTPPQAAAATAGATQKGTSQDNPATSPSLSSSSRPAIYIQVERRGSGTVESPRSSRSSSITGQTITLHEFTDDLVEDTVREGMAIAQFAAAGYSAQATERASPTQPPSDLGEIAERVADSLVSKSLEGLFQATRKAASDDGELVPKIATPESSPATAHDKMQPKQPTSLSMQKQTSIPNGDSESTCSSSHPPLSIAPQLLSTPNSRVSYAWSTASTRDEDSRPVSPTDMERIGIGLASSTDEYASLFSNIILRDAFNEVTGSTETSRSPKHNIAEGSLPTESARVSTMDTYLSSLDQAEPPRSRDEQSTEEVDAAEAYYSHWHKIRACLLRPLATGNWGCGAFGGDPQLKCMLQWIATSASGRPHMVYYTFGNKDMEQLSVVVKLVLSNRWTVGQLSQAVLSWASQRKAGEEEGGSLFDTMLKMGRD